MFNEGNQIHNLMSSSGSGTVINYGSGSNFLTSFGSGSGSTSQKVTVPTVPVPVPVPVPQHCGYPCLPALLALRLKNRRLSKKGGLPRKGRGGRFSGLTTKPDTVGQQYLTIPYTTQGFQIIISA
jgi:hypothetical protein